MKRTTTIIATLALTFSAARAGDRFRLDVTLGQGELDGTYATSDPDATFPKIDLADDLGIEDPSRAPGARLAITLTPRQKLVVDYVRFENDGQTITQVPVSVGGSTVLVDIDSRGKMELTSLAAGYAYSLVQTDGATVDFYTGLERLEATASVDATDAYLGLLSYSRHDSKSETGPIVGFMVDVTPFSRVSFDAHVSYALLPLTSTDIKFMDAEAGIGIRLFSQVWARGSYRLIDTDVDGDDWKLDLTGRSLALGVTIRY